VRHARHRHGREEIDRVPEASLDDQPVREGENGHRNAADDASPDPRPNMAWKLDGHPGSMSALADAGSVDLRTRWQEPRRGGRSIGRRPDPLDPFLGKDLAPPADPRRSERGRYRRHSRRACVTRPAKARRDTQSDDHRPRRRRREGGSGAAFRRARGIIACRNASSPRRSGRIEERDEQHSSGRRAPTAPVPARCRRRRNATPSARASREIDRTAPADDRRQAGSRRAAPGTPATIWRSVLAPIRVDHRPGTRTPGGVA